MTRKTKNTISTILRYVVLCAVGVLMFYPMLWMVGASLKADNNEIYSTISFIPKNPSFAAYVKGWTATGYSFGKFMMNTYCISKGCRDRDLHDHHCIWLFKISVCRKDLFICSIDEYTVSSTGSFEYSTVLNVYRSWLGRYL